MLVGLSGGADSVCLLMILNQLKTEVPFTLMAAHVNHQIRGRAAREDEQFCEALCKKLGIPFYVKRANVTQLAKAQGMSVEEAGRHVRYAFFQELKEQYGVTKIATAHHKDDQVETILHNLIRGSGLQGMTGISSKKDGFIRPLLAFTKADILLALQEWKQSYCQDATNTETMYTRNKIRHTVIPVLNEINEQAGTHIVQFGSQAAEIEGYLEVKTEEAVRQYVRKKDNQLLLQQAAGQLHVVIQKRLVRRIFAELAGQLKDISAVHVDAVLALWKKQTGRHIRLPYEIVASRTYDGILFSRGCKEEQEAIEEKILPAMQVGESICVDFNGGSLYFSLKSEKNYKIVEKTYTKAFDYDRIDKSIVIRTPKAEDYLTINKAGDHKLLRRYFIDEKIPVHKRQEQIVLADGGHILWVVGYRISENYKITKETRHILEVTWEVR